MGYRPSGFFVLRTPLLPVEDLLAWTDGLAAEPADRERLRARLAAIVQRPEVREALFIASPSLDASIDGWLHDPTSEPAVKVERSLVRYVGRMITRPTPFGLFAGTSVGTIGGPTALALAPRAAYRRHARLDCDYLSSLCDRLATSLHDRVRYRPSSSLYRAAGRLRYASRAEGRERSYVLIAIEPSPYLEATLDRARGGARLAELAAALVVDEISLDEATGFVAELIASQVLVPELEPRLTGDEPLDELIAQLREAEAVAVSPLARVADTLARLDHAPLGDTAAYRSIATELAGLPAPTEPARLIQVDLVKPAPALALGGHVVDDLLVEVERLGRCREPLTDTPLTRFRTAFAERYEDRSVPLVEALDEEAGIGFAVAAGPGLDPSPLLDGLPFPPHPAEPSVTWTKGFRHLAVRVAGCLANGERELVLDARDWAELAVDTPAPLPEAFAVHATIAARSAAAIDEGAYTVLLEGAYGPPGATMLGRFCHADPELARQVAGHLRAEEAAAPDAIFAEIVHLPEGRLGNISLRPVLRGYEIPFLGRSGAPLDRQLPIDDLVLSLRRGRLVLGSRRLGREIRPRLTTAHDFERRSLGIYRFLCALARQDRRGVSWSFGPLDALPHLPAVRSGRTLLALERWRLRATDLAELGAGDPVGATRRLRARHRWPRRISVVDDDNVLAIDLDSVQSIESFAALVKGRTELVVRTTWPEPVDTVVTGPEGRFAHELVVPVVTTEITPTTAPAADDRRYPRRFAPGSAWTYVKLYAGEVTADRVLTEVVAPLVGDEPSWFFLRYHDPASHVRVRIRDGRDVLARVATATEPLLADGRLWRVQLDTYERELERYGGGVGVELAERLFHADSVAVLGILALLDHAGGLDARWRLALRGMDQLLDDVGLELPAKLALVERARDTFAREHRVDLPLQRAIGDTYRAEQVALATLLDRTRDPGSELAPGLALLAGRSRANAPIVAELRDRAGELTVPIDELAASYLHMHANRLLRSSARAHELVIYDLLARLYRSRRARGR